MIEPITGLVAAYTRDDTGAFRYLVALEIDGERRHGWFAQDELALHPSMPQGIPTRPFDKCTTVLVTLAANQGTPA